MIVQFNTDKNIVATENMAAHFKALIEKEMAHLSSYITRVEAHLSDENGSKKGANDMRCVLEARLEGHQPIAVTHDADTHHDAVSGACTKLTSALSTIIGKQRAR